MNKTGPSRGILNAPLGLKGIVSNNSCRGDDLKYMPDLSEEDVDDQSPE